MTVVDNTCENIQMIEIWYVPANVSLASFSYTSWEDMQCMNSSEEDKFKIISYS